MSRKGNRLPMTVDFQSTIFKPLALRARVVWFYTMYILCVTYLFLDSKLM